MNGTPNQTATAAPPAPIIGGDWRLILALAVAGLVSFAYAPVLEVKSLLRDDHEYLVANPLVQTPGWSSARRFLSEVQAPSTVQGYYQPLSMISLMLDAGLGGGVDNLRPFRRTSLTLHALNAALLTIALTRLLRNAWVAAALGLMFGVHPLTVESVAWLSDRKTLLASFFALGSLCLYLRHAARRSWLALSGAAALYALGLLAKPTIISLPVVWMLLDVWPLRRFSTRTLLEKAPFLVIALVSAIVTFQSQKSTSGVTLPPDAAFPVWLLVPYDIVFYLSRMFWPTGLTPFYEFPQRPWLSQPGVLAGLIGCGVLLITACISLRWTRGLVIGLGIFLVAIFPALGVVGFTDVVAADRFTYFPFLGGLLMVGAVLARLWARPALRVALAGVVAAALVGETFAMRAYLDVWRDNVGLHRHTAAHAPHAPEPQYNLGLALADAGLRDEALAAYRRAIELKPDYAAAYANMGTLLRTAGRLGEAERALRSALQITPNDPIIHNSLGNVLREQNRPADAVAALETALRLDPNYYTAHNTLAGLLVSSGRLAEGVAHFRQAIALAPQDVRPRINLAVALAQAARVDEALQELEAVVRIQPTMVQAHFMRGRLLEQIGRRVEAVAAYRRTLELAPGYAEAAARLEALLRAAP